MAASTLTIFTIVWSLLQLTIQAADQQPSYQPCPLLRAYYDAPTLSKSSDAVKSLSKDFDAVLDNLTLISGSDVFGPITSNTTSFSVVLFSGANNATEDPIFFTYHYTAPQAKKDPKVTDDTVFALGSLTQLFTVYAWLVEMGIETWNNPITKYLPKLKSAACGGSSNITVDWDSVTIEALAGHMAGIARESNACELGSPCDKDAFIKSFAPVPPVFRPNTTPLFSSAAYQLLAFAISSKSNNTSLTSTLSSSLLHPLNLTHTSLLTPTSPFPLGHPIPPSTPGSPASLSLLSTPHDLAHFGSSILSSALLPATTTRRWLSPQSADTSNIRNGVGSPWEVYRAPLNSQQLILDILLKSGGVGAYSSYLGLVPDLGVGFAVLAHDETGAAADLNVYADVVADRLEGIVGIAASQFAGKYAGNYSNTTDGEGGAAVFGIDKWPGLVVRNLTLGKRDVRAEVAEKAGVALGGLDWRVYPSNVWDAGRKRHQFVGVVQDKGALVDAGTPTCTTWMDGVVQGVGGRVVFELDGSGKAVAVEVEGLGSWGRSK